MVHTKLYRVIYGDTDKAGVVYYGNYLRFFEIGRTEFFRDLANLSYKDLEEEGIMMPVVEAYVRYKSPAFYDDLLSIETAISGLDDYSVTFFYRITRHGEDKVIVQGSTKLTVVDKEKGSIRKMPSKLLNLLDPLVIRPEPQKANLN
ncbi:4-hydroxybenzoyl-CoA thioesterase family active site [Dissulfuribacter thermophilus]|uniref:4-hydroxybenzoyl-CoA thioesterase family active site n=1 Tax=Dissulfuribacter thermophilus TaxID=1156395 RepID=A0A1B9F8V5_9BACT|nr:thioesterase family protein [Dissulfuribacter thermophilus]OCC16336.1 4-hydroxybenzoyl-CoA thioesterase family active site [Dissulfuribacter thermophilus]